MAPSQALPTSWQVSTYLFGVCLFSISFLVFLNSSVSFVITDIIGQQKGVGDAAGSLGFADELVAIIACPIWGILSDRLGIRIVAVTGYIIIGLALFIFVQATNVYPQLLLARMFFSIGGAACTTMVTATLPSISATRPDKFETRPLSAAESEASEITVTPANWSEQGTQVSRPSHAWFRLSGPRLAGLVGTFTGCGALIALSVFLPLPSWFQKMEHSAANALKETYYLVGIIALLISFLCFFGLRNLKGEDDKGWHKLWLTVASTSPISIHKEKLLPYWKLFYHSVRAGAQPEIGLGYVGGLVARASSVGISLFIPLLVNHYFISSGICKVDDPAFVKLECREAYVLAAKLTGVSQLVALILAPAFGYFSDRKSIIHIPLLIGAISGIIGYSALAFAIQSPDPKNADGTNLIYLYVSLIGASQISAIVCSLGSISRGISESDASDETLNDVVENHIIEHEPLLANSAPSNDRPMRGLAHLKGSIAGTYSLAGGVGILFLTKVGGALFDSTSVAAPFVILLGFNAILLVAVLIHGFVQYRRKDVAFD